MLDEVRRGMIRIAEGAFVLLVSLTLQIAFTAAAEAPAVPDDELETPAHIWERCQKTLLPFNFEIQKDEIVTSDTRPDMKLRRVEVKFYSQELQGKKWGHPCVVYIPADESITETLTYAASGQNQVGWAKSSRPTGHYSVLRTQNPVGREDLAHPTKMCVRRVDVAELDSGKALTAPTNVGTIAPTDVGTKG